MKKWLSRQTAKHRRSTESMRRFYDRAFRMYGIIERRLGPTLDEVIAEIQKQLGPTANDTALEHACGTGLLTLKLSPFFRTVEGKDLSSKMLARARRRAGEGFPNVSFSTGDLLAIDEPEGSFDYVYVSFALHLFGEAERNRIIEDLLRVARKEVIIIDHAPPWEFAVALVEWLEGSRYQEFIETDFQQVAGELGVHVETQIVSECLVMRWRV